MLNELKNYERSWILRLSKRQSQFSKTQQDQLSDQLSETRKLTATVTHGTQDIVMLSVIYIN